MNITQIKSLSNEVLTILKLNSFNIKVDVEEFSHIDLQKKLLTFRIYLYNINNKLELIKFIAKYCTVEIFEEDDNYLLVFNEDFIMNYNSCSTKEVNFLLKSGSKFYRFNENLLVRTSNSQDSEPIKKFFEFIGVK